MQRRQRQRELRGPDTDTTVSGDSANTKEEIDAVVSNHESKEALKILVEATRAAKLCLMSAIKAAQGAQRDKEPSRKRLPRSNGRRRRTAAPCVAGQVGRGAGQRGRSIGPSKVLGVGAGRARQRPPHWAWGRPRVLVWHGQALKVLSRDLGALGTRERGGAYPTECIPK